MGAGDWGLGTGDKEVLSLLCSPPVAHPLAPDPQLFKSYAPSVVPNPSPSLIPSFLVLSPLRSPGLSSLPLNPLQLGIPANHTLLFQRHIAYM
jgi:hypothetical protein